ncbi:MAG: hypothetical protein C9356_02890 [Oleiphilus sp.]|nr:MAG: hypothetical protein C9356_02890 [Oleiphilus sp.]
MAHPLGGLAGDVQAAMLETARVFTRYPKFAAKLIGARIGRSWLVNGIVCRFKRDENGDD